MNPQLSQLDARQGSDGEQDGGASDSWSMPVDVYSPDQLSEAIMELQAYADKSRPSQVSETLKLLLDSSGRSPWKLLEELQAKLASSPVAHITLAALPARSIKRQFTVWFRTEIHPDMLLTFAARADIGGGAVVQAGSHLYDFSFKSQILSKKQRIAELASV